MSTAISSAIDTLRPVADDAGVNLQQSVAGSPAVRLPGVTLTRLCVALVDNAVYHSPRGETVMATVTATVPFIRQ